MTELDLRNSPWNEGLGISTEFLDYQIYILACMVHASAAFEQLGEHPIIDLRQRYQETEIGRLLLTIAAAVRNAMDQNPSRATNWLRGVNDKVGTLELLGSRNTPKSALYFREACNKLIHCHSINFDYIAKEPIRGMALNPVVHIFGFKGDQEWKATIDINRFVEVATQLT